MSLLPVLCHWFLSRAPVWVVAELRRSGSWAGWGRTEGPIREGISARWWPGVVQVSLQDGVSQAGYSLMRGLCCPLASQAPERHFPASRSGHGTSSLIQPRPGSHNSRLSIDCRPGHVVRDLLPGQMKQLVGEQRRVLFRLRSVSTVGPGRIFPF